MTGDGGEPRGRLWRTVIGWALVGLAVVQGGVMLWLVATSRPDVSSALPPPSAPLPVATSAAGTPATSAGVPSRVVPLVVGLDAERALEVLTSAGLDGSRISLVETPRAGPAGLVVGQEPTGGSPLIETSPRVLMLVSAEAETPDLVGMTLDEADAAVNELGGVLEASAAYRSGVEPDVVLDQDPSPGSVLPSSVRVTVAAAPAGLLVTELDSVDEDGCDGTLKSVDGIDLDASLRCRARLGDDPAWLEYDLARDFDSFTAIVGTADDSTDTTAEFIYRVIGDGEVRSEVRAGFGASEQIDVSVGGVLRLRLEVVAVWAADDGLNDAVWGNPTVYGAPVVVAAAVEQ